MTPSAPRLLRGATATALLSTLFFAACRLGRVDVYTCDDPCTTCEDPCDPCSRGECVPEPSLGWEGPVLLWTGTHEADAPACPSQAPAKVYEGHDGFRTTSGCAPCQCEPARCEAPAEVAVSSEAACGAGGILEGAQPVSLPDGWSGACLGVPAIPQETFDTFGSTSSRVGACMPTTIPTPKSGSFAWDFFARACARVEAPVACLDPSLHCAPRSEGDFRQCVFTRGDETTCPEGYPKRRVFFGGVEGDLGCTPCTCSAPEGGTCVARVSAFRDASCTQAIAQAVVDVDQPGCTDDVLPGDLRGVAVSWPVHEPAHCTPDGGKPTGRVTPASPSTFCCTQ
ncbi:hypothetical protein [Chondromyces crocatus]|uniref:Uncharacterized protein n=1 Tax=Chondromyces crocatus TaxID=52 RepID=A0A0K1ELE0_CHOCO|nr:hypothetical protein [Chondromyces crocatus]AKT41616.1 uncharacterized protein CMC5_058230 [Chondromyces crocatus]